MQAAPSLPAAPLARSLGQWRPDFLKAHAADPERFPFLLESASQGSRHARFDISADCAMLSRCKNANLRMLPSANWSVPIGCHSSSKF